MRSLPIVPCIVSLALCCASAGGCEAEDTCGNGAVEAGESCDGSSLAGASCRTLGFAQGALRCSAECLYDVSGCSGLVDCGNGAVDAGEQCDGDDLRGQSCESRGLGGGTLACDPITCQLDTTGCEGRGLCGDGVADGDEECDGDDLRGLSCAALDAAFLGGLLDCTADCRLVTSGCYGEPDFPVGQPCTGDAECPGGLCLPEVGAVERYGPPAGLCVEPCAGDDTCPLSGVAGQCVAFPSGVRLCLHRCDPVLQNCRDGYACQLSGDHGYCYPHCTDDAQCEITGDCDTDSNTEREGFCLTPDEFCTGGVDDDFDGLVDCADPDCTGETGCPTGEICLNGVDDDGDGYADCDDAECAAYGPCQGEVCTPAPGGALTCGEQRLGQANDAAGSTSAIDRAECLSPSGGPGADLTDETGPEFAHTLTVASSQRVTVTVSSAGGDLDLYVIRQTGGQYCDPYQGCFAYGGAPAGQDEVATFAAHPGVTYYLVVDGHQGATSGYDITVTCEATGFEDCGNGVDDDGDTLIDCSDPECFDVPPHCAP